MIMDRVEDTDSLLILDEAYIDFVADGKTNMKLRDRLDNVIVLRSLTKSYTIPGLRIGYAISSEKNIKILRKVKPPWTVSIFAQKVGVVALKHESFIENSVRKILKSKIVIESILPVKTDANFYLYHVGDAKRTVEYLLKIGIFVRDCTSFNLPEHIRFSVRKDSENMMLIDALKNLRL
jgi:histidinol-phosphate aminotransferase